MIGYRDATAADGAVLGGMARATFIETFGALYSLANLEAFLGLGSDCAYAAELANPAIEVRFAQAGDAPIGFCKIGPLTLPAPNAAADAIELRQLYVYKPWHGAGVAAVLTEWALARARARGASEVWLSVFTHNPRARKFYGRYGFEDVAPYHFMVGDQADEDILCRVRL